MSSIWQPISTAPKDGTRILIFEAQLGTAGIVRVSRWRDDTIPNGWTGAENAPSHWLPLPVPPNVKSQLLASGPETRADAPTATILSMFQARRIARSRPLPPTPSETKKE
jgi:hypothetical protein